MIDTVWTRILFSLVLTSLLTSGKTLAEDEVPSCRIAGTVEIVIPMEESNTLTCKVFPGTEDLDSLTFSWFYKKSHRESEIKIPDKYVSTRGNDSFLWAAGGVELRYGGAFLCRASNSAGQQETPCRFSLTRPGGSVQLVLGRTIDPEKMIEGYDIYMECTYTYRHLPIDEFSFFKEEKKMLTSYSEGVIVANSSLLLQAVSQQSSANYSCQISSDGYIYRSSDLEIKIKHAPKCVHEATQYIEIRKGEEINLSCDVYGNPNNFSFIWYRSSTDRLSAGREFRTIAKSSGTYFCLANNEVGRQRTPCGFDVRVTEEIVTQHKEYPSVVLRPLTIVKEVPEGSEVRFLCFLHPAPRSPVEFTFYREGYRVNSNEILGISINEESLVIQHLLREHGGEYKCRANITNYNNGRSYPVDLSVAYPPICSKSDIVYIPFNSKSGLECRVNASPGYFGDVVFRWRFREDSNRSLEISQEHFTVNGTTSVLSSEALDLFGVGRYYCWSSNRIGWQKLPCQYVLYN